CASGPSRSPAGPCPPRTRRPSSRRSSRSPWCSSPPRRRLPRFSIPSPPWRSFPRASARSTSLDKALSRLQSSFCNRQSSMSVFQHRLALRLELIAWLPLREFVGVGDAIADRHQQLRVFRGAPQIPIRLHLIGRRVIVLFL